MSDKVVRFQLARSGIVLAAIGLFVFSVLVFAAGWIAGSARRGTAPPAVAVQRPALPKIAAPALPSPAVAAAAVLPSPSAAKPPEAAPQQPPQSFTLRVAAFASEEEAQARVQELATRNLEATIVAAPTSSAAILYSVCVGRYDDRAKAAAAAAALAKSHALDAAVIPAR